MKFLKIKEIDVLDIDSPERTLAHGRIIRSKKFLFSIYKEWYFQLLKIIQFNKSGRFLELGSGACIIKDFAPSIITSDVIQLPGIDQKIFADSLPYKSNSLDGIIMIDVFHHIPNVSMFLSEADRVLKIGGTIVMSEPWNCGWSKFIYKKFHHEPFNVFGDWTIPNSGPLSGANGALPWIVFVRDKKLFQSKFPNLKIELIQPHTATRYLLSGGVSMKQLVPDWSFKIFSLLDLFLQKLNISMFSYILIRKVK